jgi:hypothetical protein
VISRGQRYRTTTPLRVLALTCWAAPYTGGYERTLAQGEEFDVSADPPGLATAVMCDAVDYRRLHREFIPWRDRLRFWSYRGFYLSIDRRDIEKHCELTRRSDAELALEAKYLRKRKNRRG